MIDGKKRDTQTKIIVSASQKNQKSTRGFLFSFCHRCVKDTTRGYKTSSSRRHITIYNHSPHTL